MNKRAICVLRKFIRHAIMCFYSSNTTLIFLLEHAETYSRMHNIQINELTFAAIAVKQADTTEISTLPLFATMIKDGVICHRQLQSVDKYRESQLFPAF